MKAHSDFSTAAAEPRRTLVVGDLHLGSSHCRRDALSCFLDSLQAGDRLVLNGDTVDSPAQPLSSVDRALLCRLLHPADGVEVVWIEGNHDDAEAMRRHWGVESVPQYRLDSPVPTLILHGVCFDTVGRRLRHGVGVFRMLHKIRLRLGLTSLHFAAYAKRWRRLYRMMRSTVRRNAVRHAQAEGVELVVCGHVHCAEDSRIDGIRYINTGSWVESENRCLEVAGQAVALRAWPEVADDPPQSQAERKASEPGGGGERGEDWRLRKIGKPWHMRFFRGLIRLGGRRPAYHIMYMVVFWYMLFVPEIRRRTRYYLDRRFPDRTGGLQRFVDSCRLVCNFGRTMIDRFAFAALGGRTLEAECPDIARLQAVLAAGRGAVLINAHLGCWQVAMSILSKVETPVSVVMIPPADDEPGSHRLERELPFQTIDPRGGLDSVLAMMQSLRRGEILGLMGDRVFGSRESTVTVDFLGGAVDLPFSPYRLAGAAGVPIIVLFSHKADFRRYEIRVARIIEVAAGDARRPRACRIYARQFAEALEEFVQAHPWQYFNFYDLWSERAAEVEKGVGKHDKEQ